MSNPYEDHSRFLAVISFAFHRNFGIFCFQKTDKVKYSLMKIPVLAWFCLFWLTLLQNTVLAEEDAPFVPVLPLDYTLQDIAVYNTFERCEYFPTPGQVGQYHCDRIWESVWRLETEEIQEITVTFSSDRITEVRVASHGGSIDQFEQLDDYTFRGLIQPFSKTITFYTHDFGSEPLTTTNPHFLTDIVVSAGTTVSESKSPYVVLSSRGHDYWSLQAVEGVFDPPVWIDDRLGIQIADADSTNTFGYLETKESLIPLPEGLYRITFNLGRFPYPDQGKKLPDVRLRAFADPLEQLVLAHGGPSIDSVHYKDMTVFWESDGKTEWKVALDLLSFDPNREGGFFISNIEIYPLVYTISN